MNTLLAYLNSLQPDARDLFAANCGTSVGYLRKACSIGQKIGADLCIEIERESAGQVRVEDLRPDVDWAYLRCTDCETKQAA
jgi:DNA-binding transcriptional regulator YdaS (Cro superfamily)